MHERGRRARITQSEFEFEMRLAGIAHIMDVEWAVLERQGKISFTKVDGSDVTVASD